MQPPFRSLAAIKGSQAPCRMESEKLDNNALKIMGESALNCSKTMGRLWQYIINSRNTFPIDRTSFAARNAITALNLAGYSFSGKDLSGINIPEADLSRGLFYKTNFTGANLAKVKFNQACLGNAQFADANLTKANFGSFALNCQLSDKEYFDMGIAVCKNSIALSSSNTKAKSWKIHIWSDEGTLLGNFPSEAEVTNLLFTPDEKFLIVSTIHSLKIWDVEKSSFVRSLPLYVSISDLNNLPERLVEGLKQTSAINPLSDHQDIFEIRLDDARCQPIVQEYKETISQFLKKHFSSLKFSVSSSWHKPLLAVNMKGNILVWDLKNHCIVHFLGRWAYSEIPYFVDENNILVC